MAVLFAAPAWLEKIPPGYPAGKAGASAALYGSGLSIGAIPYGLALDAIQSKVYGVSLISRSDPLVHAELLYLLENLILYQLEKLADVPAETMTFFEKESLLFRTRELYRDIRTQSNRILETMLREVDIALPGTTGHQIRKEERTSLEPLYSPNYRSETPITSQQKWAAYESQLSTFKQKGGTLAEFQRLTPSSLAKLGRFTIVEYVVRSNWEIWFTQGKAGHLLLALGKDVLSAGQILLMKNRDGLVTLMVITNASGNYKPDLFSAEIMRQRLQQEFWIREDVMIVTKGEPCSLQNLKILMKARGIAPDIQQKKMAEVAAARREIWTAQSVFAILKNSPCGDLLHRRSGPPAENEGGVSKVTPSP